MAWVLLWLLLAGQQTVLVVAVVSSCVACKYEAGVVTVGMNMYDIENEPDHECLAPSPSDSRAMRRTCPPRTPYCHITLEYWASSFKSIQRECAAGCLMGDVSVGEPAVFEQAKGFGMTISSYKWCCTSTDCNNAGLRQVLKSMQLQGYNGATADHHCHCYIWLLTAAALFTLLCM